MDFTDKKTLWSTTSCVILLASILHMTLGILMLLFVDAGKATNLEAVIASLSMTIPPNRFLSGSVLILSSLMAVAGDVFKVKNWRLGLFAPQQFFLGVMAGGGIWAAWVGRYLDKTILPDVHPGVHIFCDQCLFIIFFLAHWRAIFSRADVSE